MAISDGKVKLNKHFANGIAVIRRNVAYCDLVLEKSSHYNKTDKKYLSFYHGFSLALKLLTDEEFNKSISALNIAVKRLEKEDPNFMMNYTLMLLDGDGRYLYFSPELDKSSGYDTRYYNAIGNECSVYDNVDVLDRLSKLKGFDINKVRPYINNQSNKTSEDYVPYSERTCGFPLSLISKKANMFKWCLENGADMSLKIDIMSQHLSYKANNPGIKNKSYYYDVEMKSLAYKYDGLDFQGYITKSKRKTLIGVYNEVTKENLSSVKQINNIIDLTEALINDNRVVFDNLSDYKDLIVNSPLDKKFIFQVIDLNRMDWFEKLHQENMLDVNLTNKEISIIHYAMNKRRPYMMKYILENDLHSGVDLEDGNHLFYSMIRNYPKVAVKLTAHKLYPINTDNNAQYYLLGDKFLNSDFYKNNYMIESAAYEKKMLTLDFSDFGLEVNAKPKVLKNKRI